MDRRQTEWAGTQANIRREQTELRKEKFSGVHARTTRQLANTQAVTEKYKLRVADLDEKVTDLEEKLHAASESDMVVFLTVTHRSCMTYFTFVTLVGYFSVTNPLEARRDETVGAQRGSLSTKYNPARYAFVL